MRSRFTPLQVIASPCLWYSSNGLHRPFRLKRTSSCHSCSSYLFPLASTAVRILSAVRCISGVMGLPFAGVLRNSQSKATGNPTISTHCRQNRRTGDSSDYLPVTLAARGKTRGHWCVGAVGGFFFHVANGRFFWPFERYITAHKS